MDGIIMIIVVLTLVYLLLRVVKGKEKSHEKIKTLSQDLNIPTEQSTAFLNSTIKKAQKSIERNISKSYITGCSWIVTNEESANVLYTFRNNNELLITTNGIVQRLDYELIVDNNSILITKNNIIEHYNLVNIKNEFLFLNKVSSDKILVLANQTKFKDAIKADINEQARQHRNFEVAKEKERKKYTIPPIGDHMFVSVYTTWKDVNRDKSLYDFIAYLEGNIVYNPTEYNKWQKYNKGKDQMDYAEYLVDIKYNR